MTCATCGLVMAPSLLACPSCHALVHAERLKALAHQAGTAAAARDTSAELAAWREAVTLLPAGTRQQAELQARIDRLGAALIDAPESRPSHGMWSAGALAGVALLAWKFKAVLIVLLTKGKLLALGLTNSTTLLSMLPALGVYWAAFGWRFAAGLIASIYVHEMGHVAALSRFGIAASAPMFLPGVGAIIRSRQALSNPRERARVGLAGPIWGLGAACAAWAAWILTGAPIWAAIGQFGAWVNLFNLLPVWQLDGAHAFTALDRPQRWLVAGAAAITFVVTHEGLLVLIGLVAALQAWHAEEGPGDTAIGLQYAGLVALLTCMSVFLSPARRVY